MNLTWLIFTFILAQSYKLCVYIYIYTHTHTYMYVCMCVCMYVFTEEGAHKDKMTRTHNSHAVMILSHWTF